MEQGAPGGWWLAADGRWYRSETASASYASRPPGRRAVITGGLALGALGALALIAVVWSTPTAAPSVSLVARADAGSALLARAVQNADTKGWVHIVVSAAQGTTGLSATQDAGPTAGQQTVAIGAAHATAIWLDNVAYVRVDSLALAQDLGTPSIGPKAIGQWVSFGPSDHDYAAISRGLSLRSAIRELVSFSGPLAIGPATRVDGQPVTPLSGRVSVAGGHVIRATIDVARGSDPLPVEINASSPGQSETVIFSDWGHPVTLAAPAGARPISAF